MKTSQAGIDLIKEWEGLRLKAYLCPANILTIGYGHTSAAGEPHVFENMTITAALAEAILKRDLERFEQAVERTVKVPLSQNQFDTLVSFAFNLGTDWLSKATFMKRLNKGDYDAVPRGLLSFNRANGVVLLGLTKRRQAEADMWLNGREIEEVNKAAPKKVSQSKTIGAGGVVVSAGVGTLEALRQAKEALTTANEVKGQLSEISGTLTLQSWLIGGLALVVIGGASFMMWERIKKNREGI
jgi:GH24 family phage-related lysozyme (muramidase)